MTIVFQIAVRKYPNKAILIPILIVFNIKRSILTNSRELISKLWPKSNAVKYFWSQTQFFFLLHETSHFYKHEGATFKFDNRFFLDIYPKIHFWSQV